MNSFIQILENENDISIKKLKLIFRIISKQTHPDTKSGNNESFLKLKIEYDEAYKIIEEGKYIKGKALSKEEARVDLFKKMYHFSLKFYTRSADVLLNEMIELSRIYDHKVFEVFNDYNEIMYKNIKEWKRNKQIYYVNNVFLISIKQFFDYYNHGTIAKKNIFMGQRQVIEEWAWNTKSEYKEILLRLYDFLNDEIDNKRFEYYGI
jgi:curved DNA-binding protein CbpA